MHIFYSSRLTAGNVVFRFEVRIGNGYLCYRKGFIIGMNWISIALENISCVKVTRRILFSDIEIETLGGGKHLLNGFYPSDATEIKRLCSVRSRFAP